MKRYRIAMRESFADLWPWFTANAPSRSFSDMEVESDEWRECRLAAYRAAASVMVDRYSRGQFPPPPFPQDDLKGLPAEDPRMSRSTAAYRAVCRLRAVAPGLAGGRQYPSGAWRDVPEVIGRSEYELAPWPALRAILDPVHDAALLGEDGDRMADLVSDAAQQLAAQVSPESPWHRDRHPLQDDHDGHSLSQFVEYLTRQDDPAWADAVRRAAPWHAPRWNGRAYIPQQVHAVVVTAMVVYVLAAQRREQAAQISPEMVLHALTTYVPVADWLGTALAECGHSTGTASVIAQRFAALTYDHQPPASVEPMSDGTGWSGPVLGEALYRAVSLLRASPARSGASTTSASCSPG
ncbi:hypothetical protein ITP53_04105 [Nonomuraea sp. K274]|uniref:Uncharacterized protein n=1 Tax=Nonomuraea cypriaca TaxID=1187855 RepID=A0A931A4M3_9ACTN|nr:hypothetical protein [Nonomuraea cypriaca]MBF8184935.1 hypothetical protein [Nonomuraea cypriaca]